jgi:Spy/CpxP family protein refolding chaperone
LGDERNFHRFGGFPFPQGGCVMRRLTNQRKEKTMKSRLITLTAACLALLATALVGLAQDPVSKDDGGWNKRRYHKRGDTVEHLTKTLDLTPDQQAKIQPIFEQAKPQIAAVRQDARQKIKAIRENTQAQIRPILTPDQQQKFDTLKKAREDMRKAREEMREAMKD